MTQRVEERFAKHDFARILRELADALESSQSCALYIKNKIVSVPPDGELKIEFESDNGQNGLELEMFWKAS